MSGWECVHQRVSTAAQGWVQLGYLVLPQAGRLKCHLCSLPFPGPALGILSTPSLPCQFPEWNPQVVRLESEKVMAPQEQGR